MYSACLCWLRPFPTALGETFFREGFVETARGVLLKLGNWRSKCFWDWGKGDRYFDRIISYINRGGFIALDSFIWILENFFLDGYFL